jgi:3-deoxy-D-manno-octulosonate 8-phosphate phosphatase (KDO 8-P phosphatase)
VITYKERLQHISTVILEFDGVLTNGVVYLLPPHDFIRTMNVRDSFAIQHAVKMGFRIAVITGGNHEMVRERMNYIGVTDVFLRASDKLSVYRDYLKKHQLKPENVLYVGDDLPDYPVMKETGIAVCPADAADEIKEIAHYISPKKGGEGCVRDIFEQLLKVHGKWMNGHSFKW